MVEMSATVTVGEGSEKHNHSIGFRSKELKHTHNTSSDTVIELVPYRSYQDQINEMMKPYIEEYNLKQEDRYKKAWERYNAGKIKSKPKQKDYRKIGFDYYTDHKNDEKKNRKTGKMEKMPIFRSLILGIGDEKDKNKISLEQAERLFQRVTDEFEETFPNFKILGSTLHADEIGFWHIHLDFFIMYEKDTKYKGLSVGTGLETALEKMGYVPEQSIINGRDKIPILFNAMRNKIYYIMEDSMKQEGIYLQYGVSKFKDPNKDSSKNQKLEDWQALQDNTKVMQHLKNQMMDTLGDGKIKTEDLNNAIESYSSLKTTLNDLQGVKRSRIDKNKGLIEFSLLDQLKSLVKRLYEALKVFVNQIDSLKRENRELYQELNKLDFKERYGKYISNAELNEKNAKDKFEKQQLESKVKNLENHLKDMGYSAKMIKNIKENRSFENELEEDLEWFK